MPDHSAGPRRSRTRLLLAFVVLIIGVCAPAVGLARHAANSGSSISREELRRFDQRAQVVPRRRLLAAKRKAERQAHATAAAQRRRQARLAAALVRSRTAFRRQGVRAAVATARRTFGPQVTATPPDPATALSGVSVKQLGSDSATVAVPGGKRAVVRANARMSRERNGKRSLISLELKSRRGEWTPANPLVDYTIAKRPADGISFPTGDFAVRFTPQSGDAPRLVSGQALLCERRS